MNQSPGDRSSATDGIATWLASSAEEAARVVDGLGGRGYTTCRPPLPDEPWDLSAQLLVMAAVVREPGDVAGAVLAAARGVSLVVTIDDDLAANDPLECDALLDTLGRLRPVRPCTGDETAAPPGQGPSPERPADGELGDEHRRLLDLLAGGASLAEAADTLYVSLRTANRRLSEARTMLGAPSNRAAVLSWSRHRRA